MRGGAPGAVIAVVDDGGNLMALERLDGTFAAGANIHRQSPYGSAVQEAHPRLRGADQQEQNRHDRVERLHPTAGRGTDRRRQQHRRRRRCQRGGVAQQDEELAMAGAAAVSPTTATTVPVPTTGRRLSKSRCPMWPRPKCRRHSRKGCRSSKPVAQDSREPPRARRPGGSSPRDADILYVLDGTATLVTGAASSTANRSLRTSCRGVPSPAATRDTS